MWAKEVELGLGILEIPTPLKDDFHIFHFLYVKSGGNRFTVFNRQERILNLKAARTVKVMWKYISVHKISEMLLYVSLKNYLL